MLSLLPRLFLSGALLGAFAWAQDVVYPCQAPPGVNAFSAEDVRARLALGQSDFFLYKQLEDVTPLRPKPGTLVSYFEQRFQQHPDDPRFLYLYGRSLIGKDTPQAIVYLNRAAAAAPKLPWSYPALALIYASRNFRNETKVIANMREYRGLCPGNLDAFRYLEKVKDPAETSAAAAQLRAALESNLDTDDGQYWSILWAAEFRVASPAQYDSLRKRVAADVESLKSRSEPRNRSALFALADGYKLTGQKETAAKIERELNSDQDVLKAYRAWEEKNHTRTMRTAEEHRAAMDDLSRLSAGWVLEWPSSGVAWSHRLQALSFQPNSTKEEMEKAGDEVLKADKARPMGWTMVPQGLRVAQVWVKHGIRLKDSVAMGEAALNQISLGPEVESDLTAPPNAAEIAAMGVFGFDTTMWDAMTAVLEGSAQLKDFSKARRMLAKMKQWLSSNESKKDDPTSGYMRCEARYLQAAGELAEAEGHKVDALALYVRATATAWRDPDSVKHSLALWEEQGGTKAGWDLAVERLPLPAAKAPSKFTITSAPEAGSWKKIGRMLPELKIPDVTAKMWTLANLRGKTTLINLWATWCAPCREELPHFQELYELVRERSDIQVITLNLDENPGEVQPFLTAHHYTFPVVPARSYVLDFAGSFTIPENWLVDSAGMLQQKSVGFDAKAQDWPKQMLEKLAHLPE